jgi:hypothetical protein
MVAFIKSFVKSLLVLVGLVIGLYLCVVLTFSLMIMEAPNFAFIFEVEVLDKLVIYYLLMCSIVSAAFAVTDKTT